MSTLYSDNLNQRHFFNVKIYLVIFSFSLGALLKERDFHAEISLVVCLID